MKLLYPKLPESETREIESALLAEHHAKARAYWQSVVHDLITGGDRLTEVPVIHRQYLSGLAMVRICT